MEKLCHPERIKTAGHLCRIWITRIVFITGRSPRPRVRFPETWISRSTAIALARSYIKARDVPVGVTNCTHFEITTYETELALDGFEALDAGEFEILGADIKRGVVEVSNVVAVMRLYYESEVLMLDDGTIIFLSDLIDAANRSVGDC